MKKKIALLMACVMAFGVAVGGTLAWLTAESAPVVNTFINSDINVALAETTGNEYKMIPGHTIEKNPKAKVLSGSEYCWLFVEITESANFDTYMAYEIDNSVWEYTSTNGNVTVIGRKIDTTEELDKEYSVLKGDKVTVHGSVTKAMMETAATSKPDLTFKAYASQLMKNNTQEFDITEAWNNVKPAT